MKKWDMGKMLKDAGYPQPEFDVMSEDINRKDFLARENGDSVEGNYDDLNDRTMLPMYFSRNYLQELKSRGCLVYIPTLSELIEACGKRFNALENIDADYDQKFGWRATYYETSIQIIASLGAAPEEAVANLWLALNEKKP